MLNRGTPQGGVLSPIVWNLAFDELLDRGNQGAVTMIGFADDACIIARGIDPETVRSIAQDAVDKAVMWGREVGLQFNAKKTAAMVFTNKRKKPKIRNLKVAGQEIEYVDSTRYLGIELDDKLNFKVHIRSNFAKAKRFWGLKSNMVLFRIINTRWVTKNSGYFTSLHYCIAHHIQK